MNGPLRKLGSASASLVAAAAALMILAQPAFARDGQVTVRAAGTTNESVTVNLSDLGGNDINNREYRLRNGRVSISGHSLLQVLRRADAESEAIDLETIPSIAVDRPSGSPITISGDDARNPDAFPDGPPVFYEDNRATVFVMPGTAAGSSGGRYRFVQAPVGISVGSGARYDVELSASRTRIKVGQKVTFRATVSGQDEGEVLSFAWNFNDGSSRRTSEARVTHKFSRKGSFPVILDVTGASGNGQSGISIEVGAVEKKPNDRKPEKQPSGNEGTGGQTGGGGGFGTGFGDGFDSGFGAGSGSFGAGPGGGLPGSFGSPAPPPAPLPLPTPDRDPDRGQDNRPDDGLDEVQGQLIDPVAGATAVGPDQVVPESADPAPSGTESGGSGVPGEALALAGVGLLLGLGGFAELRVFSRFY